MKRKSIKSAISSLAGDLFESPGGEIYCGWGISVSDGAEACVTGCRAILSYDESMIRIDADDVVIAVTGTSLDIVRYTEREIVIRGHITGFGTESPC